MRRALVAALVIGLTAFAPAAFADLTTASPSPPYLSGLGNAFWVESNGSWSGAKAITADMSTSPLGKPTGWDPYTAVWAKTCSKKAQTATFRRTVTLLGPPSTATLSIAPVFPISLGNPFQSYKVQLNGAVISQGKLVGGTYANIVVELSEQVRKTFQDGQNNLAVTVKRSKLPAGRTCNTSDADATGVVFRLHGDIDADLRLVDQPPAPTYRKAGTTNTQIVNLSLRNLGPAAAVPGGIFMVTIIGADVTLLGDLPQQIPGTYPNAPPFDRCVLTVVSSATSEVRCDLTAVPAGTEAFLSIGLTRTFSSVDFTDGTTNLSWYVAHPVDSTADNQRSAQFIWCGTQSTKPGCTALG